MITFQFRFDRNLTYQLDAIQAVRWSAPGISSSSTSFCTKRPSCGGRIGQLEDNLAHASQNSDY
jgi:hypothetical protein